MLKVGADLLARLSLYEQRLNRTLVQAQTQLKQLQQERAQAETRALEAAAKIRNLKEALDEDWEPEENGFEFSSTQLNTWMDRRQLLEEADDFRYQRSIRCRSMSAPRDLSLRGAGLCCALSQRGDAASRPMSRSRGAQC